MTRRWWDDGADVVADEPPAEAQVAPPAQRYPKPKPSREQLIEYRAALQRKLSLMRPRSQARRATERSLVKVTADILKAEITEA